MSAAPLRRGRFVNAPSQPTDLLQAGPESGAIALADSVDHETGGECPPCDFEEVAQARRDLDQSSSPWSSLTVPLASS